MNIGNKTEHQENSAPAGRLKRFVMWFIFHFVDPCILMCHEWECCKTSRGWIWLEPGTDVYWAQSVAIEICEKRITEGKCDNGKHNFKEFEKHSERSVYYCRVCPDCGLEEIKSSGPLGNNKWRDVNKAWRWNWEKEDFYTAISLDT